MPLLKVENISAGYDGERVIHALSFHVNRGEIISLLGPSGCGKTTALRAIAGFEPIIEGQITIDQKPVSTPTSTVPPEHRSIGMVFQDYALFPHLTVADNIAFGLRRKSAVDRRVQVEHLLDATGLGGMGQRFPHELSGGQQQRVALARALAPRPTMLLMDEPFSNLDVELRERLSVEVRDLLKSEGISGILVTHDQHEAFAVSDKIGVMRDGTILQWDTPFNLYHEPNHRFVADFIGQGRFIPGVVRTPETFDTELGPLHGNRSCTQSVGNQVEILVRPDDIVPDTDGDIVATVRDKAFKGAETLYTLELPTGTRLLSLFPSHHDHHLGDSVRVRVDAEHLICFPRGESPCNSSTESNQ
ncbi:MAG: ABC transporter ATP-binding protein [Gammaproteobacteria bacterium]|nr:ABC transporter ATP-binding protein [Gammaproteobacteria bacterium]